MTGGATAPESVFDGDEAVEAEVEAQTEEEENLLSLKRKVWGSWKWKAAWALPLLLSFLRPIVFSTNNNNTLLHNYKYKYTTHPNTDRQNRQLLEHGLRGDTTATTTDRNNEASIDFTTTAATNMTSMIIVSNLTVPLYAHSGTHHVYLYIGSPPQRQTLIVDTGSRAMAFPCKTIENDYNCCGVHASPYFDPSQSTTHAVSSCGSCLLEGISACESQPLLLPSLLLGNNHQLNIENNNNIDNHHHSCTFSQKYTEGSSWKATEVEDIVWLGTSDASTSLQFLPQLGVAYPFGCQTSTKGLFRNQHADGILGLSIHETSLVTAFYKEGLILSNSFSLCFTPSGGVLSLGGSLDPHKYHHYRNTDSTTTTTSSTSHSTTTSTMKTTPVTNRHQHGYYSVEVIRLVVGDSIVVTDANTKPRLLKDMNAGNGCILDSGTTDSYFPASLSKAIRRAVMDYGMAASQNSNSNNNNIESDQADPSLDLFSSRLRQRDYTYLEFERLLPTIQVVFANEIDLNLLPQHYMENVPLEEASGDVIPWEGTKLLTNRLYFEERKGSVLGQNAFFGYEVFFDAGQSSSKMGQEARIGIVPSDCYAAAKEFGEAGVGDSNAR